jgi:pyruvate dehydrogenase E2 component (dihydrolipoamide acetyltransferase)
MATDVIMPALGMAQQTGKLLSWLKHEGDAVTKGEPIMEVETDKATMEIEAPASGILSRVTASAGDVVPVGQTIALILAQGEVVPAVAPRAAPTVEVEVSPVARRIADEHGLDPSIIKPGGGRINKEDVLAYISRTTTPSTPSTASAVPFKKPVTAAPLNGRILASPKARRLAAERSLNLAAITGSGPQGAVLAGDVARAISSDTPTPVSIANDLSGVSTIWRIMADRMTSSWTSAPHFYLVREVNASGLVELRARLIPIVEKRHGVQPTYTDLLIKLIASALRDHPNLNASWAGDGIQFNREINIGLAVGIEDGLVVPVLHHADILSVGEIAARRADLVARSSEHHLRPPEITGATFTFTNLGMYNVDAFMAILNPPQAAILAVGRIAERVVADKGQPLVRPQVILTLSCDHRVVDGMRGAKFLDDLATLIEEPIGLLV